MAITKLIEPSCGALNQRAKLVDDVSSQEIQSLVKDMIQIAGGERDPKNPQQKSMVGLAAPQLGRLFRIILIDIKATSKKPNFSPELQVFINPVIVEASGKEELGREGCYSTGVICGRVYRSAKVMIQALDKHGKAVRFASKNSFQARIIQHEIDHLDGIRFPQRVRREEDLLKVEPDEFGDFRENWATWKKRASWQEWLTIATSEKTE